MIMITLIIDSTNNNDLLGMITGFNWVCPWNFKNCQHLPHIPVYPKRGGGVTSLHFVTSFEVLRVGLQ